MKLAPLLTAVLFFSSLAFGSDPVHGCRVKSEVLAKHAALVNNAGCVIMREKNGETQFLLVNVNAGGWGFPGGKPSSKKVDAKTDKQTGKPYSEVTAKFAANIPFDYEEPAVCTAYRETREETSLEVVVGDLIELQEQFAAFRCWPLQPELLEGPLTPQDEGEVRKIDWFSLREMGANGFLRFESNLTIAKKALGL